MNLRSEWRIDSNSISDIFYSRDEIISSVIENFNIRRFNSSEGYSVTVDEIDEQVIIQDHSNPINENKTDKKLFVSLDSIAHTGSYISYKDETWIIISHLNVVDDAYKTCQIQRCNYTLKFQSKINGTILSYPCIKKTTNTVGIDENKVISTGDSVLTIELPFDSETKLLDYDDRFIIDDLSVEKPQTFAISKPDRTTTPGIIKLTMKQDEYSPITDNKELGVCNYYTSPTPPPVGNGYSVISASGELCVGATRTLSVKFYEADGTENTSIVASWNVDLPDGFVSYFVVKANGNTCTITVNDNDYVTIDSVINITTNNGLGGYVGTKSMIVMT
jgi:hypothetical protein